MAIVIPEEMVRQTLVQGFAAMASDSTYIMDTFGAPLPAPYELDLTFVSKLQQLLSDPTRPIAVKGGYVLDSAIQSAVIGITLAGKTERDTFIGQGEMDYEMSQGTGQVWRSETSTTSTVGVHATIYAQNVQVGQYLSYITEALLLGARLPLEEAGLLEQSISMQDLQPDGSWLPDLVFVRAVIFSCTVKNTIGLSVPLAPITRIVVGVTIDDPTYVTDLD